MRINAAERGLHVTQLVGLALAKWLSGERWCPQLKWRAVSFQDTIEGQCEGVSSVLEVK